MAAVAATPTPSATTISANVTFQSWDDSPPGMQAPQTLANSPATRPQASVSLSEPPSEDCSHAIRAPQVYSSLPTTATSSHTDAQLLVPQ
mmetsp:Transcript_29131/g.97589  ORF Transcript_29131/g.97589 Transcript_29131/m.97589 type:complete len:90 (-) Transcript_29131:111-380(-)